MFDLEKIQQLILEIEQIKPRVDELVKILTAITTEDLIKEATKATKAKPKDDN